MHQDSALKNRFARILATFALAVALATVMVPYFRPAVRRAAVKTVAVLAPENPPALPACAMGDQYFEWARAASFVHGAQRIVTAHVAENRSEERLVSRP